MDAHDLLLIPFALEKIKSAVLPTIILLARASFSRRDI